MQHVAEDSPDDTATKSTAHPHVVLNQKWISHKIRSFQYRLPTIIPISCFIGKGLLLAVFVIHWGSPSNLVSCSPLTGIP